MFESFQKNKDRGMSLGSALLMLSIIALVLFALASTSVTHIRLLSHRSQAQVAENASRSAVEVALARVLEDPEFGLNQESINLDGDAASWLSFESSSEPRSCNNLEGEGSVPAWDGRPIPPQWILLAGRCEWRGVTRTTEAWYSIPPYPYAISGSAPVVSRGSLIVGGVENLDEAYRSLDKDDLLPADLASNSNSSSAVELGEDAFVAGDVTAVGGVSADRAEVRGEIQDQSGSVPLPKIPLDRYDPQGKPDVLTLREGDEIPPSIDSLTRHNGDLTYEGPLELDNGVLYVDGDFTLNRDENLEGGLRGYGALIVRGKTTIHGGSKFAHLNGVALLSEGEVEIHGNSRESSFFQGLVYSENSIWAENITVLGGLVANTTEEDAQIFLRDCRTVHVPELTQIDPGSPPIWKFQNIHDTLTPSGQSGSTIMSESGPPPEPKILSTVSDFNLHYDEETQRLRLVATGKADITVEVAVASESGMQGGQREYGPPVPAPMEGRFGGLSDGEITGTHGMQGVQQTTFPHIDQGTALKSMEGLILDVPVSLEELRNSPAALEGLEVEALFYEFIGGGNISGGGRGGRGQEFNYNGGAKSYRLITKVYTLSPEQARGLRDKLLLIITPGRPPSEYSFDPNQFLSLADKVRLQYLKTY